MQGATLRDAVSSELGDRSSSSVDMPETPGVIAQSDEARDAWEKAEANTPDISNAWVPDGYFLSRNAGGLAICVPQEAYILQIAKQAPQVMDRITTLANTILGNDSTHKEAATAVVEATKELLRTYVSYNVQFAFARNLAYSYKNAASYQSVVLAEQLDQLQRQIQRAAARGIASDNPSIVRARSFTEQSVVQLYVAVMALQAFDPKDVNSTFQPDWKRTATSYCNKRAESFTRSVLHKQVDPKHANTVDTFDLDAIAKTIAGS